MLVLKAYNKFPPYEFNVQFDKLLLCSKLEEVENWCKQTLKDKWYSSVNCRVEPNVDQFWFTSEQDAVLFHLRWS